MRTRPIGILMVSTCILATLACPWCANGTPEGLATMEAGKYGVEWRPTIDFDSITLTVSGPNDLQFQQQFPADEFPYFDYYDKKDKLRSDGVYTYELIFAPAMDSQIRKALDTVRGSPMREQLAERFRNRGDLPERDLIQSGVFSLRGGTILLPDLVEGKVPKASDADDPSAYKDIVHPDDVIIQQSLCTGFDCVNGESFGFDTLKLKENNLRIKFQDTSTSYGFPTNDWMLTANDSNNGGASFFSIDDLDSGKTPFKVEASARANALFIDGSGRVGLGTSTPAEDLHIWYGDTPTVRFHQSGGGWAPQTWDLGGNEANFFLRDVSCGSKLPIRVQPNTPSDTLCLRSSNRVGLGTWSPARSLHLSRVSEDAILRIQSTGTGKHSGIEFCRCRQTGNEGGGAIWLTGDTSTNHTGLILQAQSTQYVGDPLGTNGKRLTLHTTDGFLFENGHVGIGHTSPSDLLVVGSDGLTYCDGISWHEPSSRDVKKNIEELTEEALTDLLTVLDGVDPVKFQYKNEGDDASPRVGMIAEEMPDVLASKDGKSLSLGRHVGFLMGVVKAMHEQNKKLSQEVSELRSEMETLKASQMANPEM